MHDFPRFDFVGERLVVFLHKKNNDDLLTKTIYKRREMCYNVYTSGRDCPSAQVRLK